MSDIPKTSSRVDKAR